MSYFRLATSRAFAETRKFWNIHQIWAFGSVPVNGFILHALIRKTSLSGWQEIVLFVILGFIASWIGSYLINLIRVPAVLHNEQATQIRTLILEKSQLEAKAFPSVSPEEKRKRKLLADKIKPLRVACKQVMRHICDCGPIHEMSIYSEFGAPEANEALGEGRLIGLLVFKEKMIEINPALRDALDFVLKSEGL